MPRRFRSAPLLAGAIGLIPALVASPAPGAEAPPAPRTGLAPGTPPAWFETNRGQAPADVGMIARAAGCVALLTRDGAVIRHSGGEFRLRFAGSSGTLVPKEPLAGRSHYLLGNDRSAWIRNVPHHGGALLDEARPGTDVRWRTEGRDLRFDVELERAADAHGVRIALEGADRAAIAADGSLSVDVRGVRTSISAPVAWQDSDGRRSPVEARWTTAPGGSFAFALGPHDPAAPLVIDPVLYTSTYLGANRADAATGVATDVYGSLFLCGSTVSSSFPVRPTSGPGTVLQTTYGEPSGSPTFEVATDAFVAKVAADGRSLAWATFLGGTGNDAAADVETDANGDLLVVGSTAATNFPVTPSPWATTGAGFAARVKGDGTALLVSTYMTNAVRRVAADASGNVLLLRQGSPAEVQKFDSAIATALWNPQAVYSLAGGTGAVTGNGMALDASGNVWVCGFTGNTTAVPGTGTRYDATYNGGANDAILWRLTAATGARTLETWLGGSGDDRAEDLVVDATGVYVCGTTTSTNFPTAAALQGTNRGGTDGFVTKISPTALVWSTYFGGAGTDTPRALALNSASDLFLAGETASATNFQVVNPVIGVYAGGANDAFAAKITAGGVLRWSTYFGGSGSDTCADVTVGPTGRPACAGQTASTNFPTPLNAFQTTAGGAGDAYVFAIEESTQPFGSVAPFDLTTSQLGPATEGIPWNPGGGSLPLSGGNPPLSWAIVSGAIPSGLQLAAGGALSGAPATGSAGDYSFTARVVDADGAVVTRDYTLRVYGAPRIVTTSLPAWTVGEVMNATLVATGGRPPLTWRLAGSASAGRLPDGLPDDPVTVLVTGVVGGTPVETGDFSFAVEVVDANGAAYPPSSPDPVLHTITLRVNERPALEDVDLSPWTEGRPFARVFPASLGTPPYRWSLASGSLPVTGAVNASTGAISGNVRPAGDYTFTIEVEDAAGARESRTYSMHANPAPVVTTASLPLALVEREYGARLTSAGGTGAHVWFFTGGGSVPVGFELDGFTGRLNGTPLLPKPFDFEVKVVDAAGAAGTRFLRLDVVPFFSLAAKKNAVRDTFGEGGTTAEVRRFIELLAGSRLDGTFRLVGKGARGAQLRLVDVDTGEEIELARYAKTKGTKTTIRNLVVAETRRLYVIVEPQPGFEGTVETSLTAKPRLAWGGRVAVAPDGAPAPVVVHALGGSLLTISAKKSKRSAALPTIASVLDAQGNELLDLLEMRTTRTGVTLRMSKPVPLGEVTIAFSARPEGGAGDADWRVSLKSPKSYDVQFHDRPVVPDDE